MSVWALLLAVDGTLADVRGGWANGQLLVWFLRPC